MPKRQVWMLTAAVALMALLMAPLSLRPSFPAYLGLYALVGMAVRAKKRRSLLRPPLVLCAYLLLRLRKLGVSGVKPRRVRLSSPAPS